MKTREVISIANRYKLMGLVEKEYQTSGLTDEGFAKHATETLGCAVASSAVSSSRKALGFPSNLRVAAATKSERAIKDFQALSEKLVLLSARLEVVEKRLNTYLGVTK